MGARQATRGPSGTAAAPAARRDRRGRGPRGGGRRVPVDRAPRPRTAEPVGRGGPAPTAARCCPRRSGSGPSRRPRRCGGGRRRRSPCSPSRWSRSPAASSSTRGTTCGALAALLEPRDGLSVVTRGLEAALVLTGSGVDVDGDRRVGAPPVARDRRPVQRPRAGPVRVRRRVPRRGTRSTCGAGSASRRRWRWRSRSGRPAWPAASSSSPTRPSSRRCRCRPGHRCRGAGRW